MNLRTKTLIQAKILPFLKKIINFLKIYMEMENYEDEDTAYNEISKNII